MDFQPHPTLAVFGLGHVGLSLAVEAHRAGITTVGYDLSDDAISAATGALNAYGPGFRCERSPTDPAAANVYAICVPTAARDGRPDLTQIADAAAAIASTLAAGSLVVVESTCPPGTTDTLIRSLLESGSTLRAGSDFHLAAAPERIDPGNTQYGRSNTPKVVGGYTSCCANAARSFYRRICDDVVVARSSREAEFAKLLENAYRAVNIALVNELSHLAPQLDVDLADVIRCAATKPFGFQPFQPGPGAGGRCIPTAVAYLSHAASGVDMSLPLLDAASAVNTHMVDTLLKRAAGQLAERGKVLAGSTVLQLGVTYKPDVRDTRDSPAEDMVRLLRAHDATPCFHDPNLDFWFVDGQEVVAAPPSLPEAVRGADVSIVMQHHQRYLEGDLATIAGTALCVLHRQSHCVISSSSCSKVAATTGEQEAGRPPVIARDVAVQSRRHVPDDPGGGEARSAATVATTTAGLS